MFGFKKVSLLKSLKKVVYLIWKKRKLLKKFHKKIVNKEIFIDVVVKEYLKKFKWNLLYKKKL